MEDTNKTPHELALEFFINKNDDRQTLPKYLFSTDGKIVSTNGRAVCWTHPELCNGKYDEKVPEKISDALMWVIKDIAVKRVDREITIAEIKSVVSSDGKDFYSTREDCRQCDGTGNCDECSCDARHDCGKCAGEGSFQVPPKKLFGIGTGIFTGSTVDSVYNAVLALELDGFTYIGSNESGYLQHFRIGEDCHLILASEHVHKGQEVVPVPLDR